MITSNHLVKCNEKHDMAKSVLQTNLMIPSTDVRKSFMEELRSDENIRFKLFLSIYVCLAYGILGWTKGQLGPAFLDILVITGTDMEKGSAFMTSYYIGRMVGPIIGGVMYWRINKYLIFSISLTLCSLMVALIPWCTGYVMMLGAHVGYGISGGILVVAVISEGVVMWGKTTRSRAYLQLLNTVSAIFSVLSPLSTAPYLLELPENESNYKNSSNVTLDQYGFRPTVENRSFDHISVGESLDNITLFSSFPEPTSRLYIIYTISATMVLVVATPFYILYCRSRFKDNPTNQDKQLGYRFLGDRSLFLKRLQLANISIFSFVYFDLDFTFSGYLSAFCVLWLDWAKTSGAYLTSVVFFATMFGRISGIFLVHFFQVRTILLFSSITYTSGFVGILISACTNLDFGIWVSICIVGFPFGLSWPTYISWVNENLLPVHGKVPAFFNTIGFLGCVLNPLLLGYLMEELSPLWFSYLSVGKSVITVVNVLFMFIYSLPTEKSQNNECVSEQKHDGDKLESSNFIPKPDI